jgi:hypothetical protein
VLALETGQYRLSCVHIINICGSDHYVGVIGERLDQIEVRVRADDSFDAEPLELFRLATVSYDGSDLKGCRILMFEKRVEYRTADVAWIGVLVIMLLNKAVEMNPLLP